MNRSTPIPETVTLHVPFRTVKRGGRKEMQLPDGAAQSRRTDSTLVKALARAFRWKRMLDSGEYATIAELAEREGIATERYQAAERFVDWLADRVVDDATGARARELHVDPCGLFWLGRLAPEAEIADSKLGERAERLEPCAVGMRLAPQAGFGESVSMQLSCGFVIWEKESDRWRKSDRILVDFQVGIELELGKKARLQDKFQSAIDAQYPNSGISTSVEIEVFENRAGAPELAITLVNCSLPNQEQKNRFARARIFEAELLPENRTVTEATI